MPRKKKKSSKRRAAKRSGVRTTHGRKAILARKRALSRGAKRRGPSHVTLHGKAAKRYLRSKAGGRRRKLASRVSVVTLHGKKARGYYKRRTAPKKRRKGSHKRKSYKRKTTMAGKRKSAKHVKAGKKAARTRARHKAERAAARRGGKRKHKRHGHKRAAPRRRKRGGGGRPRSRGQIKRNNRTGKFVGRGGRSRRSHVTHYGASRKRGAYHKAGRIVREGYSMENPLDMGELATGLGMGLIGFIAADLTDRYLAKGRPPLGGTLYAEASPIYADYLRLGVGLGMAILPLAGAHFINGAKHRHIRAGLQFLGFGAGLRTLGHVFNDVVASTLKDNATVGSYVQGLYPHEIVSQGMLAAANAQMAKTGAGALPEHIGAEVQGMGAIPEGLAACCNASSRMLNTALSPLQPIGRSAEGGGAAANFAPPPVMPPIERIVQQPYTPAVPMRQPNGGGGGTTTPVPPPGFAPQQPQLPARQAMAPGATSMAAAYAPVPSAGAQPAFVGPAGLPTSPFVWGDSN